MTIDEIAKELHWSVKEVEREVAVGELKVDTYGEISLDEFKRFCEKMELRRALEEMDKDEGE